MILDILDDINNSKNNIEYCTSYINTNFKYNYDLLVDKNKLCIKKIISSLNKITSDNYFSIYFSIIDIINDKDLNRKDIISFIYKKIYQNSFYIDTYINFILLNQSLTIEFINYIQNIFENDLQNNPVVIDIISIFYQKNIITNDIYQSILHLLFDDTKQNIDYIIQFYKCIQDENLKNKILNIPNLSFRYKYKLE